MSGKMLQQCPICQAEVNPNARYPRYLCRECAAKAVDEAGRALSFSNIDFSGGFAARYADTGEKRDSHDCLVNGVKCRAGEARFGGIVIQACAE